MKKKISIVGAGFSGILLCYQLIDQAKQPFDLLLIEKNKSFASGIAYKTKSSKHYLNVKAGNMSALPQDPDHFYCWLITNPNRWQHLHPSFKHIKLEKNSYLPRILYGTYLQSIWEDAWQKAKEKGISIEIQNKEVISISYEKTFTLSFSDNIAITSDICILACGVPENKCYPFNSPPSKNYIHDVWNLEKQSILQSESLKDLPKETTIAIIGSGLTMLDALATLEEKCYLGTILVISNHGRFPEEHKQFPSSTSKFISKTTFSKALDLIKTIRKAVDEAESQGYDWRIVIDELRPHTQKIWMALPKEEKRKLLPLLSLWNRHRHRMPKQYADLLQRIRTLQSFELISGTLKKICPTRDGFSLILNNHSPIYAHFIFNCSGPSLNILQNSSPLIQNMLETKMIKPDELNLGISVDSHQSAKGVAEGHLFVLGQLLFGTKLEITAVPELRVSCQEMATNICLKFEL